MDQDTDTDLKDLMKEIEQPIDPEDQVDPEDVAEIESESEQQVQLQLQREISINNDSTATANSDLCEKRLQLLQLLRNNFPKEGDTWYLIPRDFLEDVMNLPVELFQELVVEVGLLDLTGIVDARGNLYPEDDEPVGTYNVLRQVFDLLCDWFGTIGDPVARALVINPKTRKIEVERFPSYFEVHVLGRNGSGHGVHLSTTKTFYDLFEAVRVSVLKSPLTSRIRLWFLAGENIDTFPLHLTLIQFLDIQRKQLVLHNQYLRKLKEEGLNSAYFHVCVEVCALGAFPTDSFLKDESTGGYMGLTNLGNTCYMNLALQCLVHIPEINNYFYYNVFEKELNETNPLGYQGDVAKAFGSLLHKLFPSPFQNSNSQSILPRDFKFTVGHFLLLFQGYQQQDSQEFLSWLLDALHEDLNRIYDKPYNEKPELLDEEVQDPLAIKRLAEVCWKQHKARNDLVITDLFTGLYQLTLVCPTCAKTSVTFDPFNDLTLPLPMNKRWYHTFIYVEGSSIRKFEVELSKTASFDELLTYLSDKLDVPRNELFLYEIFNNFFYKDFQANYNKLRYFPIGEIILDSEEVVIYRLQFQKCDLVLPVINSMLDLDRLYNVATTFGIPLFVILSPEDVKDFEKIQFKLNELVQTLENGTKPEEMESLDSETDPSALNLNGTANDQIIPTTTDKKALINPTSGLVESELSTESAAEPSSNLASGIEAQDNIMEDCTTTNPGFVIKYHLETRTRQFQKVHIPHNRANFNNLPSLKERIPTRKCEVEGFVLVNKPGTSSSGESEKSPDNLELHLNPDNSECEADADKILLLLLLLDEEMGGLGLLFDSVETPKEPNHYRAMDYSEEMSSESLVTKNMTLICEWSHESYKRRFQYPAWENIPSIPNLEASLSKSQQLIKSSTKVTLQECLTTFSQPEVLGDQDLWYCPRCKESKQATKTIQLWSTGDYLTIHLKRFESARLFSDKIDLVVDFPVEELDMLPYVEKAPGNSDENVYDLVAVDNHYGGLGGGHYTAYAKNFKDGQWYYFNDSRVTNVADSRECVSAAAYLLFYRRRTTTQVKHGSNGTVSNGSATAAATATATGTGTETAMDTGSSMKLNSSDDLPFGGDSKLQQLIDDARTQYKSRFDVLEARANDVKQQVQIFKRNDEDFEDARRKLDLSQVKSSSNGSSNGSSIGSSNCDIKSGFTNSSTARRKGPHSVKKGRSLIDPSELGNEYINSALHRKQRLIRKDTETESSRDERAVLLLSSVGSDEE